MIWQPRPIELPDRPVMTATSTSDPSKKAGEAAVSTEKIEIVKKEGRTEKDDEEKVCLNLPDF
jgi:hypothetical protein